MAQPYELYLPSGRLLYLRELRQFLTYEGLLAGLPTAERNQQRLERLVAEHRDKPYEGEPYLCRPKTNSEFHAVHSVPGLPVSPAPPIQRHPQDYGYAKRRDFFRGN